jgi:hypothetical protein
MIHLFIILLLWPNQESTREQSRQNVGRFFSVASWAWNNAQPGTWDLTLPWKLADALNIREQAQSNRACNIFNFAVFLDYLGNMFFSILQYQCDLKSNKINKYSFNLNVSTFSVMLLNYFYLTYFRKKIQT